MKTLHHFRAVLLVPLVLALLSGHSAAADTPVTYERVLELLELEVKEEKIISMIERSPTHFTLGENQIATLIKAGASEKLVDALQKRGQKVATGSDASDFIVILDCSGSMKDATSDGSKWEAAQQAAIEIIESVPDGRKLALIVYGHNREDGCKAVKVLRPLFPVRADDKSEINASIMKLRPVGNTPIALSLQMAMRELEESGDGLWQVVLITDGLETCEGDPAAEARKLAKMQKGGRVDVIGYSLNDKESNAISLIAESGNGKYYDAKSIKDLTSSVKDVKQTISNTHAEDAEVKDMEAATPVKASPDVTSPAKLPFGKYVKARLGIDKSHYWAVDLEPGDYQFVWEPKRADDRELNLIGNIFVGKLEDGEFKSEVQPRGLNTIDYRARLICDYNCTDGGKRVVKVLNEHDIVDYVLAVYKKGEFSNPFLTKCPPIHKLQVGESATVQKIDGNSVYNNSQWYVVRLPADDVFLDATFARSDGNKNANIHGGVSAYTLQGEKLSTDKLVISGTGMSGKGRSKLVLAEEGEVLLRVWADYNQLDNAKHTAKFKITSGDTTVAQ